MLEQNFNRSKYTVRFIYLLGLLSWFFTLIGFYFFFQLNTLYWIFAIPVGVFSLYYLFNYGINLWYQEINIYDILQKYSRQKEWPSVDVFLPVCGESKDVLNKTWEAVKNLDYPNLSVYVGDDKGLKWVEKMAKEYGFNYLSRSEKGKMKKTGNLQYLFENSSSPFYIVFDADFRPHKYFIQFALPHIIEDDSIAILQTPQAFEKGKNSIENAASDSQDDFYKIIQTARDSFGAAICVGSNAIFRRSAIEQSGIFSWLTKNKIDHGEDVNTGFKLMDFGYKVKYLPINIAFGESPNTISSFIKQRNRWCSSSTRMFLSGIVAKSNLTFDQKICFYTGFLYYLADTFKFVLNYMLFVVLVNHGQNLNVLNALFFLPHILFGMVVLPILRGKKPTLAGKAIDLILVYTNTLTFINRLRGKGADWVPTGNVDKKDNTIRQVKIFSVLNFVIYITVFLTLSLTNKIPFDNIQAYTVLFWVFYFIINHLIMFKFLYKEEK